MSNYFCKAALGGLVVISTLSGCDISALIDGQGVGLPADETAPLSFETPYPSGQATYSGDTLVYAANFNVPETDEYNHTHDVLVGTMSGTASFDGTGIIEMSATAQDFVATRTPNYESGMGVPGASELDPDAEQLDVLGELTLTYVGDYNRDIDRDVAYASDIEGTLYYGGQTLAIDGDIDVGYDFTGNRFVGFAGPDSGDMFTLNGFSTEYVSVHIEMDQD